MQKYLILTITIFIAFGCYKDTDFTQVTKTEREPRIIVDGSLVGEYIPADNNSNVQFSMLINGAIYLGDGFSIPYTELKNIEKKGQFIEFFENGIRTGATQLSFIENDINYVQVIGVDPFNKAEFNEVVDLGQTLKLDFVDPEFSDGNSTPISENLKMTYHYTEDRDYLNQLISFTFGKTGKIEVVNTQSSFYIGVEHESKELEMVKGEILVQNSGEQGQSLYYFNKEENSWEWISDFVQGVNKEKIVHTGYYAIGESIEGGLVKGHVRVDDLSVVNQRVQFTCEQFKSEMRTSSTGKFEGYIPADGNVHLQLINHEGTVIQDESLENRTEPILITIPQSNAKNQFLKSDFEVLNCDGSLTGEKSINIQYEGGKNDAIYLEKEAISWIPVESSSFLISAGDGPKIDWSTDKGAIHYLSNCSSMQNGFTFMKIRSDQKMYPAFRVEKLGERTYLEDEVNRLKFIVETSTKGSLETEKINISVNDDAFGESGYFVSCEQAPSGCGIQICEITHYKEDGDEWNRIYFEGKIWMQTINPAQAGNFNVEGYILSKR